MEEYKRLVCSKLRIVEKILGQLFVKDYSAEDRGFEMVVVVAEDTGKAKQDVLENIGKKCLFSELLEHENSCVGASFEVLSRFMQVTRSPDCMIDPISW